MEAVLRPLPVRPRRTPALDQSFSLGTGYLAIEPAKLDRIKMVRSWTWPCVVAFKVAPDLYQIKSYSQAKVQAIRTAHVVGGVARGAAARGAAARGAVARGRECPGQPPTDKYPSLSRRVSF
ncbi:MAG: hypothetical protein GY696_05145 [Gammaproteobacteria bacterium]|nr:hypothetical protein [Gammaproteobacteria bacterium]